MRDRKSVLREKIRRLERDLRWAREEADMYRSWWIYASRGSSYPVNVTQIRQPVEEEMRPAS